jgi:hypothetical protein
MYEHYLLEILKLTGSSDFINISKRIIEFVKEVYRSIEPSHFDGKIIVFYDFSNSLLVLPDSGESFYDKGILNSSYESLIFQIKKDEEDLPLIWNNVEDDLIDQLLSTSNDFIAYVFENNTEYFMVNDKKINIQNNYSCPSIFALQYHYLNEALLDYKSESIRKSSCELFKNCWDDAKWIYLKNKPEECMQISLKEFLRTRIRGVNVVREYPLGASKPVDVRVFWREANRAALIELKLMGQTLKSDGTIGTEYTNKRGNDGMSQIKEYIDLDGSDSPTVITKGYLVVIDGRRKNIKSTKVSQISREDGFHYQNNELSIDTDKKYWETFPNIEKPIRMFVEPICEI